MSPKGKPMTFDHLVSFVSERRRMSHIYQPLLIKSLVNSNGMATICQLAHEFLTEAESQLLYYEKRIKEMLVPVLGATESLEFSCLRQEVRTVYSHEFVDSPRNTGEIYGCAFMVNRS